MPRDQNHDPDDFRMPLGEHLEELRSCIVHSLIGSIIAVVGCFFYGFHIISWLAQPMLQVMRLRGYPEQLITTDATAGFGTYLKVSLIAAIIVASPWILYQAWKFIATGLYAREKKLVYILAPFSTLMTVLAVLFVYYILLPAGLWFFFGWADKYPKVEFTTPSPFLSILADAAGIENQPLEQFDTAPLNLPVLANSPEVLENGDTWINGRTWKLHFYINEREYTAATAPASLLAPLPNINEYVKFAAMIGLGIVVAFQTPVVMLVVGWTGTIDPKWLKSTRKYALMACALSGAILTPNDPITMLLLGIPLYLLFEFGLFLMTFVYREPEPFDPDDPLGLKAAGNDDAPTLGDALQGQSDDDYHYDYDQDHMNYGEVHADDASFLDDLPPENPETPENLEPPEEGADPESAPDDKNLGRSDDDAGLPDPPPDPWSASSAEDEATTREDFTPTETEPEADPSLTDDTVDGNSNNEDELHDDENPEEGDEDQAKKD